MTTFPAKFAINEQVVFIPMYRHQQAMGIGGEEMEGKIVAVRFTEAKVFYDIYSNYWGAIFDNVDSAKVHSIENHNLQVVQESNS